MVRGAGFAKIVTPSEFDRQAGRDAPKRSEIDCFSARSRQRLRIKIASIRLDQRPWFCTLTYPAEWVWDSKLWKRHLKVFSQRFLRRWPCAGFIWKLEFQKRGAPHFHPFIWGLTNEDFADFIFWVSKEWNEVVCGDPDHLAAGTSVERIRSIGAALRYVSGYASKVDQSLPGRKVGRYWGVVGKRNIPWGENQTIPLDQSQAKFLLRTCRRYILATNRQTRIRIVAKQLGVRPQEFAGFWWFDYRLGQIRWGKHLRASGGYMPQKLRLRNLRSVNVFLNSDFWLAKLLEFKSLGLRLS